MHAAWLRLRHSTIGWVRGGAWAALDDRLRLAPIMVIDMVGVLAAVHSRVTRARRETVPTAIPSDAWSKSWA
jgi:hypothetical protein